MSTYAFVANLALYPSNTVKFEGLRTLRIVFGTCMSQRARNGVFKQYDCCFIPSIGHERAKA